MIDEITKEIDENSTLEFDKENHDPEITQEKMVENSEKRIKKTNDKRMSKLKSQDKNTSDTMQHNTIERCKECKQKLNDIKLFEGPPNNACEEVVTLTDPKLCLFDGDESSIHQSDERPQNKITHFR